MTKEAILDALAQLAINKRNRQHMLKSGILPVSVIRTRGLNNTDKTALKEAARTAHGFFRQYINNPTPHLFDDAFSLFARNLDSYLDSTYPRRG